MRDDDRGSIVEDPRHLGLTVRGRPPTVNRGRIAGSRIRERHQVRECPRARPSQGHVRSALDIVRHVRGGDLHVVALLHPLVRRIRSPHDGEERAADRDDDYAGDHHPNHYFDEGDALLVAHPRRPTHSWNIVVAPE